MNGSCRQIDRSAQLSASSGIRLQSTVPPADESIGQHSLWNPLAEDRTSSEVKNTELVRPAIRGLRSETRQWRPSQASRVKLTQTQQAMGSYTRVPHMKVKTTVKS